MEIVVGINDGTQSQDALALGLAISSATKASLTVVNVYPVAYDYPSQAHVDAEWRSYLAEQALEVLNRAKEELAEVPDITYLTHPHRSSGLGLAEVAEDRGADMIVIGSAAGGSQDRFNGGSTSEKLFHGSPVPVAVAPYGYRIWAPQRIARAVIAYQRTNESDFCIKYTVRGLRNTGIDVGSLIHLITLTPPVPRTFRKGDGSRESAVLDELRKQASATLDVGKALIKELAPSAGDVKTSVLDGEDVARALSRFDWQDDDVLIVGSTGAGPIRRVFLGDMTYKFIRASSVPVIIVPRSATPD